MQWTVKDKIKYTTLFIISVKKGEYMSVNLTKHVQLQSADERNPNKEANIPCSWFGGSK